MSDALDLTSRPRSRRSTMVLLGGGCLGLPAFARGGVAQEATPTALPPVLSEWIAGWQVRDADRIAAIYADDATHEVVATGETLQGRAAIRDNLAGLMTAVPDATLQVKQAFAAGEAGVIDWSFAGHYSAQLPGFPPPADQSLALRGATIFNLAGVQVIRSTEFYDLFGLLVQTGAIIAPGAPAGATPTT